MKKPRRSPHNPARDRCLADLSRELRRRHDRNPRRVYARRQLDLDGLAIPMISQGPWRVAVAARWYRRFIQED